MVTEIAEFTALPDKEEALRKGLLDGMAVIRQDAGCHAIFLRRCIEDASRFILQITWSSLEAHTRDFRTGPLFAQYRAHINGLFVEPPTVRHYTEESAL